MFIDSRAPQDTADIQGTIGVIGGGAAGITLALELAKQFNDVLLIESGGLEGDAETQALYEGPVLGHGNTDLATSRLRFLGGTTNHWNGQCAPLDAVDFEPASEHPHSGWPFRLDELTPFYQRAYSYCELGTYRHRSPFVDRADPVARQLVDSPQFELGEFRYSPPTRFGQRFRHDLGAADRIKVYLHCNVVDMSVTDGGNSISAVQVRTLTGRRYRVKAAAFVLCCGGIENARILLNCTSHFPAGIGNQHELVGRFFMDHLIAFGGSIAPLRGDVDFRPLDQQDDGATPIRVVLKNSAKAAQRAGYGGCSMFIQPVYEISEATKKAKEAPAVLAMQDLARESGRLRWPQNFEARGCSVLGDVGAVASVLYQRMTKPNLKSVAVFLEGEQSPNPESRVVLTDEWDALGMRRAGLNWRIAPKDRANMLQTAMELARGLGASGFGRMQVSFKENDDAAIATAWHHMGTTRMHDDKTQGVVDRNCRVHQIENLFIAGSSVFPTGGRVNPTLTIVALAVRLADHLKATVKT
jgi:choline dehydrogenase-like flavoprotein